MFVLPPAFSNALWLSYSQFVPGNTGISTLGFAIETFAFFTVLAWYVSLTAVLYALSAFIGNTSSNTPVIFAVAFLSEIVTLPHLR